MLRGCYSDVNSQLATNGYPADRRKSSNAASGALSAQDTIYLNPQYVLVQKSIEELVLSRERQYHSMKCRNEGYRCAYFRQSF
jgi:hypothetical protein